jgi:hypothetical protein
MLDIAAAMGRMHAATIGRQEEFNHLRLGLGKQVDDLQKTTTGLISRWSVFVDSLGLAPAAGMADDLARMRQSILDPGPFLAYIHRDPCPDNWLKVGDRMRLFDFEWGGFRHALLDGMYGRIHFPTCWCVNRFPADLPEEMENIYRLELAHGCPQAGEDTVFYPAVVETCAFWFLVTCEGWNGPASLMEEDGQWGIATLRQRVLVRGKILSDLTDRFHHLQVLGDTIRRLLEILRSRWPEEADLMPLYPAFRDLD